MTTPDPADPTTDPDPGGQAIDPDPGGQAIDPDPGGQAIDPDPGGQAIDPDSGGPVIDPGAASERTRLAWRRTGLSAAAVTLLVARPAVGPRAGTTTWLIAALGMAAWVALVAIAYRRLRGLRRGRPGRRAIPAYALIIVALATLGGLVVML